MLCEWQPPVPTLWHEHRYQVSALFVSAASCHLSFLICQLRLYLGPYMLLLRLCHIVRSWQSTVFQLILRGQYFW